MISDKSHCVIIVQWGRLGDEGMRTQIWDGVIRHRSMKLERRDRHELREWRIRTYEARG